jgi:hypothetical protein
MPAGFEHPPGHGSTVYINRMPPPWAHEFPVGTIILRVTPADRLDEWEAHGMVKRGGGYNAEGARGWEFFDLHLTDAPDSVAPTAHIAWRGESPPEGDGYEPGEGQVLLGCNHCHGAYAENDSVLGPELDLRTL